MVNRTRWCAAANKRSPCVSLCLSLLWLQVALINDRTSRTAHYCEHGLQLSSKKGPTGRLGAFSLESRATCENAASHASNPLPNTTEQRAPVHIRKARIAPCAHRSTSRGEVLLNYQPTEGKRSRLFPSTTHQYSQIGIITHFAITWPKRSTTKKISNRGCLSCRGDVRASTLSSHAADSLFRGRRVKVYPINTRVSNVPNGRTSGGLDIPPTSLGETTRAVLYA